MTHRQRRQRHDFGRLYAIGAVAVMLARGVRNVFVARHGNDGPRQSADPVYATPATAVVATTPRPTSAPSTVPPTTRPAPTVAPTSTVVMQPVVTAPVVTAPPATAPAAPSIVLAERDGRHPCRAPPRRVAHLGDDVRPATLRASGRRLRRGIPVDRRRRHRRRALRELVLRRRRPHPRPGPAGIRRLRGPEQGQQVAVAAMYMLPFDSTFADVPDVGGALTQWHVHRDPVPHRKSHPQDPLRSDLRERRLPARDEQSRQHPDAARLDRPQPCGPFAALEGIGAGQVPPGQTRNCDTRNASVP